MQRETKLSAADLNCGKAMALPHLSDWITAASTALTAVFAGFAGVAAWLSYRREVQRDAPIVEADFSWSSEFIIARIRITNTQPRTIVLSGARVTHPSGCKLSPGFLYNVYGIYDLEKPKPSARAITDMRSEIPPADTMGSGPPGIPYVPEDYFQFDAAIFPPASWRGGRVVVVLEIATKESIARHSRITVQRRMPPKPHSKTAEMASKAD